MLVGAYPFEDPADPKDFKKTISVSVVNCKLIEFLSSMKSWNKIELFSYEFSVLMFQLDLSWFIAEDT